MISTAMSNLKLEQEEPLFYAAAEGNAELVQELVGKRANFYKPVNGGGTALHAAIFNERREVCEVLLGAYEKDFKCVEEHFVRKFQWKGEKKFWLKKNILVACSEKECELALELEQSNGITELNDDAFEVILLMNASGTNRVVTLKDGSQIEGFIQTIKTNGYLTWEYRGFNGNGDSLLQFAVLKGAIDIIRRLINNGANLAQPGRGHKIPLMEACETKNMQVIKLLLEHTDRFDPTVSNHFGETALSYVARRAKVEAFDYVLHKLMEYRKKTHQESDNEAFNKLFRLEHPTWPEISIWSVITDTESFVEPYLEKYEYDLSFSSGHRVMLMELIMKNIAKEYYQSQIRQKPDLLELTDKEECNVLHCLLWSNEVDFVRELYASREEQCRNLFQRDGGAAICVTSVLKNESKEALRFLLDTHLDYVRCLADEVMDRLFDDDSLPESFYDEPLDIWVSFLPEMEQRVDELKCKFAEEYMMDVIEDDVEWRPDEDEDPGLTYRLCGGLD